MNFETMSKAAIDGSPELTEDDVASALCNDPTALYPYGYRVAALVVRYVRKSAAMIDDDDWQDVVQECMAEFPNILNGYDPSKGKLFKYLAGAYINIMRSYVRRLANGGMGSAKSNAAFTVSYDELAWSDDAENSPMSGDARVEVVSYGDNERFGMRDPAVEAEAHDTVRHAILFAQQYGKVPTGPNPEWDIPFTGNIKFVRDIQQNRLNAGT